MRTEVADVLKTLSKEEREELRLELSRKKVKHDEQSYSPHERRIYECLFMGYKVREYVAPIGIHAFARNVGIAKYKSACNYLVNFISFQISEQPNKEAYLSYLINTLVPTYADYMFDLEARTNRVTFVPWLKMVSKLEENFSVAIESAYPGLLGAKNLALLLGGRVA